MVISASEAKHRRSHHSRLTVSTEDKAHKPNLPEKDPEIRAQDNGQTLVAKQQSASSSFSFSLPLHLTSSIPVTSHRLCPLVSLLLSVTFASLLRCLYSWPLPVLLLTRPVLLKSSTLIHSKSLSLNIALLFWPPCHTLAFLSSFVLFSYTYLCTSFSISLPLSYSRSLSLSPCLGLSLVVSWPLFLALVSVDLSAWITCFQQSTPLPEWNVK